MPKKVENNLFRRCVQMGGAYGGGFALLVVLFILLIIIGAAWIC
jgi:uncharacterized protein (TIGR01732 family)